MEELGATIDFNGFMVKQPLVLMVAYHWSNDGMVTYYRWCLMHVLHCTIRHNNRKGASSRNVEVADDVSRCLGD